MLRLSRLRLLLSDDVSPTAAPAGTLRAFWHRSQRLAFDIPSGQAFTELALEVKSSLETFMRVHFLTRWSLSKAQEERLHKYALLPLIELQRCIREDAVSADYDLCISHSAQGRFCLALGLHHWQDGGFVIDIEPVAAP